MAKREIPTVENEEIKAEVKEQVKEEVKEKKSKKTGVAKGS